MTIQSSRPVPGTAAYWRDRRQAFELIRTLEEAIRQRDAAPHYRASSYCNEDGEYDDVIENIRPWDRVVALQDQGAANPTVVEILTAHGRLALLSK
jgi:hypothetical protein